MKKLFLISLMGVALLVSYHYANADSTRQIAFSSGAAVGVPTVIVGHGATLYHLTGFASSSNATYSVHDVASVSGGSTANVKAEGGEATQYDSIQTLDFGPDGLDFSTGIMVYTTTATISVLYR